MSDMADDDTPHVSLHSVEVRIAVVQNDPEQPDAAVVHVHCTQCGTVEDFTLRLEHAPMAVSALHAALADLGLAEPRPLQRSKEQNLTEAEMRARMDRKRTH